MTQVPRRHPISGEPADGPVSRSVISQAQRPPDGGLYSRNCVLSRLGSTASIFRIGRDSNPVRWSTKAQIQKELGTRVAQTVLQRSASYWKREYLRPPLIHAEWIGLHECGMRQPSPGHHTYGRSLAEIDFRATNGCAQIKSRGFKTWLPVDRYWFAIPGSRRKF